MDPNNSSINNDSLPPIPATPQTPTAQATIPPQPPPTQEPIDSSVYPQITVTKIENPSRFYAFPALGMFVKDIMLIPAIIFFYFATIFAYFLVICNSFVVLFTGKYWKTTFDFEKQVLSYNLKYIFFLAGLTNKYPGFNFEINDIFSMQIDYPQTSSRLYAFPIFGGIIRNIMLIPFGIYTLFIAYGAILGVVLASFVVLFTGKYPDTVFELVRDTTRLFLAQSMYMMGIKDEYPSYKISWDHKPLKIILIFFSVIIVIGMLISSLLTPKQTTTYPQFNPTQQNIQLR